MFRKPRWAWKATLDSVDQGANGIPVADVSLEGNRLKLDVAAVKGTYDAEMSADGKTLTGEWQQGGLDVPLTFTRGGDFERRSTVGQVRDGRAAARRLGRMRWMRDLQSCGFDSR